MHSPETSIPTWNQAFNPHLSGNVPGLDVGIDDLRLLDERVTEWSVSEAR